MSRIAFIYPGQGAQKTGMGKDFYENCPVCREVFDKADELLDFNLKQICFEENELLNETSYTQPALVTTCLAITKELFDLGILPEVTAGLSLGEYAAIAAAGGMDFYDAITCVRSRGIYMSEAVEPGKGGMAAVLGMSGEDVAKAIDGIENVSIANYNCPGQVVITGLMDVIEKGTQALKEAGAKRVLPLKVSGPFHSAFLQSASRKLGEKLKEVKTFRLNIPYVTNVTAEYVDNDSQIKELLQKQVVSSVCWEQSMRRMLSQGIDTFVEIGPGRTLAGFMKKINPEIRVINIGTVEELKQAEEVLAK